MNQVSVRPVTAARRSHWHALRPVLVLGGFVAVWWALMTGVAQADDGTAHHQHLVDHLRSQVKAQQHTPVRQTQQHRTQQHRPVRDLVRPATSEVEATTTPLRHQVREAVRPVTHQVTRTTTTIHSTLSETVQTTRGLLQKSPAGPAVDTVEDTVKNATGIAESSTVQGNSPKLRHSPKASVTALAGRPSATLGAHSESPAAPDRAAGATHREGPLDGPRAPALPDPCSSPSGSGASSFAPVGVTESSLLVMPQVQRDLRPWRLARLPGGPAYQPGSSPD
jgi:hypothetical protein